MDNIYLNHELKHVKDEPELIKARFKYGLVLVGLGLIQHFKLKDDLEKNNAEEFDKESIEQKVFEVSKALAPILLPLIDSLGSPEMEEYAVSELFLRCFLMHELIKLLLQYVMKLSEKYTIFYLEFLSKFFIILFRD